MAGVQKPTLPIYSNVTAKNMQELDEGEMVDIISKQAASPVAWEKTILKMIENKTDVFIEIGVGKTLVGLCKKINREIPAFNIDSSESLEKTLMEVAK